MKFAPGQEIKCFIRFHRLLKMDLYSHDISLFLGNIDGFFFFFHLTLPYFLNLQFGYIVLTTSAGIMDHEEARRKNVGGKVLGFFY